MASPAMAKLKALMTKNLLEMKRNIASTICEIFFPVIIIGLFLGVRTAMGIETYEFKNEEKSIQNYIFNRSTSNTNFSLLSQSGFYNESVNKWKGLHIFPPLDI